YRAFSNNTTILPVAPTFGGNVLTLLANPVASATSITLTIQDNLGSTVNVAVTVFPELTVAPPELLVLPNPTDIFSGIQSRLTVVGGVAPYRAFSSNSALLPVTQIVTGNTIPLLASDVATTTLVTVTVLDAIGQVVNVQVTVHPK